MRSAGEGLPGALHPDLDSALEDKSEKIKGNVSSRSSKRSGKENLQRKKKEDEDCSAWKARSEKVTEIFHLHKDCYKLFLLTSPYVGQIPGKTS